MNELDRYLAQQLSESSAGSGQFTLDPARQREILARMGLAEADHGFLKLVQAAVGGHSPDMRWATDGEGVRVEFGLTQAPPIPWWDAPQSGVEWHQDLTLGLLTLSQNYELSWSWQFQGATGSGQARGDHFSELQGTLSHAGDVFVCHLRETVSRHWWSTMTSRLRKLLENRCHYAPLPIRWQDGWINRLLGGGRMLSADEIVGQGRLATRGEAFLLCSPEEDGDLWLPLTSHAKQWRLRCGEALGAEAAERADVTRIANVCRGWAALGASGKSWSETTFVYRGVLLPSERNLLDRPGIVAVISGAGLKSDLTGLQLVHDDSFRQRLSLVRSEVRWLEKL